MFVANSQLTLLGSIFNVRTIKFPRWAFKKFVLQPVDFVSGGYTASLNSQFNRYLFQKAVMSHCCKFCAKVFWKE